MSLATVVKSDHIQEFSIEWKIENLICPSENCKTELFAPVKHWDAKFYLELWCQSSKQARCQSDSKKSSPLIILNLIKIPSREKIPFQRMNLKFYLKDLNDRYLLECSGESPIDLSDCHTLTVCVKSTDRFHLSELFSSPRRSPHSFKVQNHANFFLKCRMQFLDPTGYDPIIEEQLRLISNKQNFTNDFHSIYKPGVLTDIEIVVDEKSFPAHKAVLAAHSPVFLKMLTHDCLESKSNLITITDATHETFELFLYYLYSGGIQDKCWSSVAELYALADKYDVGVLKQDCADILFSEMSVGNICEILKLAYVYNDSFLKEKGKGFAAIHLSQLFATESWKELVLSIPLIGFETMETSLQQASNLCLCSSKTTIKSKTNLRYIDINE